MTELTSEEAQELVDQFTQGIENDKRAFKLWIEGDWKDATKEGEK